LSLGEDAILGSRLPQPQSIKALLLFVGYGLHIPETSYDDFKELDIHGKIIVYINGGPASIAARLKSNARAAQEFIKFVAAQGALGIVSIPNPKSMDIPWSRIELSASQRGCVWPTPHCRIPMAQCSQPPLTPRTPTNCWPDLGTPFPN